MPDLYKEIEDLHIRQQIHYLTYRKTGLYVLYPFLALVIIVVCSLFLFRRDVVIELTGMISNPESGLVVASMVSGQIEYLAFNNHSDVSYGDVLIILNTNEIERQLRDKQADIEELYRHLSYINQFENSIMNGENLLESDAFGYRFRVEQHLRLLENEGIELAYMSQVRDENRQFISSQLSTLESLITDYQNFNHLVNGLSYEPIHDDVVHMKVNDFSVHLNTFTSETADQRQRFIANTLLSNEQRIASLRDEVRNLNQELMNVDRTFYHDGEIIDRHTLSANEDLLFEIFEIREGLLTQLSTYERDHDLLREQYNKHTITALSDGRFQLSEEMTLGQTVQAYSEIGRLINLNSTHHYISSHFSSIDFSRIRTGQEVRLVLTDGDNNRQMVTGQIETISKLPTQTQQGNFFTFQASINRDTSNLFLQYGMTGELHIITGRTTIFRYLVNRFF